jgi:cohesin loading factor subunit SCC2
MMPCHYPNCSCFDNRPTPIYFALLVIRVIKIFRDILLSNPTYQGRAAAMNCMLQRASDRKEVSAYQPALLGSTGSETSKSTLKFSSSAQDDNVRDLIFETFHTLWFDSSSFNMSVASLAVDSKKTPQAGVKAELYCREAVTQMVEVVKAAGTPDDLTCLVKGLLFGFDDDDKDKKVAERKRRQQDARGQCKRLVSSLFEILLHFEDTRTNQESDGKELVAIFSTLGVFSQAYPELLVPHVDTVVPYLKGDNGAKRQEAQVVSNVSNIISRITSNFSQEELSRLTNGGLPTDLVNIAYKFPSDAVNSAVEALCKLSNHPHAKPGSVQEKKLHKLACQFYSYLIKTEDSINGPTTKKSIKDNIRRALSALGGICRYYVCDSNDHHNIDPSTFSDTPPVDQLQFSDNVLSNACFSIFLKYLSKDDEATKCLALRAMTGVFISRPRVVLCAEQMGIINEVMSDDAAASVQIEALKSWRDILLAEEIRIESGAAKAKMASQKNITVSNRISGDQDGDSSISGSVLTKHAPRLYEMTMSKDEKVRYMIVDLIGHLLRQGLINPMETVPYLLAMQGDVKSQSTRSLALKLLINEGEKRPDMLNQRIQAGVKRAFNFQKAVYPQESEENVPSVTALLENNSEGARVSFNTIFDEVIKESSIRNKKAQRQALYKSIIGMFEREAGDSILTKATDSTRDDVDRLPLLAFASQILAHLPYNCTADPLFIVYHASCITALEGNELLLRLAELVGNDVCDPNAGEDELEKCAKLKNPKTSAFASKLIKDDDNFSATEFGALCEKASGLM